MGIGCWFGRNRDVAQRDFGVPTLLPRACRVLPTSMESDSVVEVAWPDLVHELGLRPVPGLFPERYRVEFPPDAATTARLSAGSAQSSGLSGSRG